MVWALLQEHEGLRLFFFFSESMTLDMMDDIQKDEFHQNFQSLRL
jgi:hypothetical protein